MSAVLSLAVYLVYQAVCQRIEIHPQYWIFEVRFLCPIDVVLVKRTSCPSFADCHIVRLKRCITLVCVL